MMMTNATITVWCVPMGVICHTPVRAASCSGKVRYTDIAKFAGNLPHRYGNSRAIWDHTVLPATR